MNKVLISGGSGFLGSHLVPHLKSKGYSVSILSRKIQNGISTFLWDVDKGTIDSSAFNDVETVIHLAGAGIADHRWTKKYKKEIIQSRTKSAQLIFDALKKNKSNKVNTIISASAIGYYGDNGNTWVEEDFHGKEDFLGIVCTEWEKSAKKFEELGIRVVILRIGLILAKDGGLMPVMKIPMKYFLGAPLGDGKQYMSWIHIDDLIRIFLFMIGHENTHGTFNAVAPGPVTNKEFIKALGHSMKKPVWPIGVPSFLLKAALGEKSEIVLSGQRVSSEKIRMTGFNFFHTDLYKTLKELV